MVEKTEGDTMVKKSIFTFQDSWPWALIVALVVGGGIKAIAYAAQHGADPAGFVVLGIMSAAFLLITASRYLFRALFIIKWNEAFHTRLGMAILPNEVQDVPYRKIDEVCDAATFYWAAWAVQNTKLTAFAAKQLIATAFYEGTISVVPKPITNSWGKFLGLQDGKNISVVFDKEFVIDDASFLQLVKHEVSHLCLEALGIIPNGYGDNHHEIFAKMGYC
jgi:hypothetical protein